jgi:Zn-dependent M32 family carboxypeptidase
VPHQLIKLATGTSMNMTPYLDYLREKYAVLYPVAPERQ